MFKIINRNTQQYAKQGKDDYNIWSKKGKIWNDIGDIKRHVKLFLRRSDRDRFRDYALFGDIIEYNESGINVYKTVIDLMIEMCCKEINNMKNLRYKSCYYDDYKKSLNALLRYKNE